MILGGMPSLRGHEGWHFTPTCPRLSTNEGMPHGEVERQLGLALRRADLPKASPGNQHSSKNLDRSVETTGPKSLSDLRISRDVSSRSQLFAKVGPKHFQVWMADLSQQGKCPSLKSAYLFARQLTQGKSAVKKRLHARPKATSDDPLDNATGHLKLVDNLLRDLYVGDTSKFTPAKGRLLKRYVNEMGQFILKAKTDRSDGVK